MTTVSKSYITNLTCEEVIVAQYLLLLPALHAEGWLVIAAKAKSLHFETIDNRDLQATESSGGGWKWGQKRSESGESQFA